MAAHRFWDFEGAFRELEAEASPWILEFAFEFEGRGMRNLGKAGGVHLVVSRGRKDL